MKFKDIVGHSETKKRLASAVNAGRISHALLFSGNSGFGTLPLALSFISYINCIDRKDGDSCGKCPSCLKISELAHPDLHFVFPLAGSRSGTQKNTSDNFVPQFRELWKRNKGVFDESMWYAELENENAQGIISRGEADEVIKKLSFKAFEADYKSVIIWLPEKMRAEAANALLKILEEPWENTLFILVSEQPDKLLPTILSRTQQITIEPLAESDIAEYLVADYQMNPNDAEKVAGLAAGDLLRARKFVSETEREAESEMFEYFTQLMRFSYNDRHMELMLWAETIAGIGRERQKKFFEYSVGMLRQSYLMNAGMNNLVRLWGEELDFCKKFYPFIGNQNIESLVNEIETARWQIAQNGNPKIIFTHFALTVSKMIGKTG